MSVAYQLLAQNGFTAHCYFLDCDPSPDALTEPEINMDGEAYKGWQGNAFYSNFEGDTTYGTPLDIHVPLSDSNAIWLAMSPFTKAMNPLNQAQPQWLDVVLYNELSTISVAYFNGMAEVFNMLGIERETFLLGINVDEQISNALLNIGRDNCILNQYALSRMAAITGRNFIGTSNDNLFTTEDMTCDGDASYGQPILALTAVAKLKAGNDLGYLVYPFCYGQVDKVLSDRAEDITYLWPPNTKQPSGTTKADIDKRLMMGSLIATASQEFTGLMFSSAHRHNLRLVGFWDSSWGAVMKEKWFYADTIYTAVLEGVWQGAFVWNGITTTFSSYGAQTSVFDQRPEYEQIFNMFKPLPLTPAGFPESGPVGKSVAAESDSEGLALSASNIKEALEAGGAPGEETSG
jgi:hypothetical protein